MVQWYTRRLTGQRPQMLQQYTRAGGACGCGCAAAAMSASMRGVAFFRGLLGLAMSAGRRLPAARCFAPSPPERLPPASALTRSAAVPWAVNATSAVVVATRGRARPARPAPPCGAKTAATQQVLLLARLQLERAPRARRRQGGKERDPPL